MTNPDLKGGRARGLLGAAVVGALAVAGAIRSSGDTFTIVRSTFAAGGGTSTGGDFTVASTIAQPEAGAPSIGGGSSSRSTCSSALPRRPSGEIHQASRSARSWVRAASGSARRNLFP